MRQRERGTRIPVERYIAEGWTQRQCFECHGTGMRPGSGIPYACAANACSACGGRGSTWTSPQGRVAQYPGGPWMGR
jgi:hypothetical protein